MKIHQSVGRKTRRHGSGVFEAPRKGRAMSRVYNVMTGVPRPSGPISIESPEEEVWVSAEESPFVEIGGPAGPVFSASQNAPRIITEAKVEAKPEAIRS